MILNWCRTGNLARQTFRKIASGVQEVVPFVNDHKFVKAERKEMTEASRRTGVLAFKRGMMSHYDKWGFRHPVTILDVQKVI